VAATVAGTVTRTGAMVVAGRRLMVVEVDVELVVEELVDELVVGTWASGATSVMAATCTGRAGTVARPAAAAAVAPMRLSGTATRTSRRRHPGEEGMAGVSARTWATCSE